jgi:hypothetical protein
MIFGRRKVNRNYGSSRLHEVTQTVRDFIRTRPLGLYIDPNEVVKGTGLDGVEVLAALNVLRQNSVVAFCVLVLDEQGHPESEYDSLADVPKGYANDSIEIVFRRIGPA